MAGQSLTVEMANDDHLPAWQTVIELADTDVAESWTLVGGLMVAAHARRAGVVMRRPTDDVDVVVDYASDRRSLTDARAGLLKLGFELDLNSTFAYRFRHSDGRTIDVMVADHLPSRMEPRMGQRPAFAVDAGEQAIRRRDTYRLEFRSGASARVGVADELAALVMKGAAYLVDSRDRDRHLDDTAVLLACIADVSTLAFDTVSTNDRRRIKVTTDVLADSRHRTWANVSDADASMAMMNLILIRRALHITP